MKRLEDQIEKLKPEGVYIYGAGITARKLLKFLQAAGCGVHGFVIDKEKEGELCGLPVYSANNFKSTQANLILGFVPTSEPIATIAKRVSSKISYRNLVIADLSFLSFGNFDQAFQSGKDPKIQWLYDVLADELSRKTISSFITSRNSTDPSFAEQCFIPDQYFPSDIIQIGENEVFVDCGVFDGQTTIEFINKSHGRHKMVYGFEPDLQNFERSVCAIRMSSLRNVKLLNMGTWSTSGVMGFAASSDQISVLDSTGDCQVRVEKIDSILQETRASFIKMDVEGAELESLRGAVKTIQRDRPRMAICIYHKPDDLVEIPMWINSLKLGYKFYVRLHTRFSQELVLYCVA
jgi:FkbM family methyltransferase